MAKMSLTDLSCLFDPATAEVLREVKSLDLQDNWISSVPQGIGEVLPRLEVINLNNNLL